MAGMVPTTIASPDAAKAAAPYRLFRFALPVSLILTVLLAVAFLNGYQNWGDDWAQYMLQAKAILNRDLHDCIEQNAFMTRESSRPPGPIAYPWGLPLLLALEAKVFSFDLRVFKLFNILIFVLLVLAINRLAGRFVTEAQAVAVALMFAFNPVLLHYCNHVLTELPFTLASVCAFLSMENGGRHGRARGRFGLLTGILAFVAVTFRTNGIMILAAATVRESLPGPFEKGWRRPAITTLLAPYLSFSLLYTAWRGVFPAGGDGYLQMLRGVSFHTLLTNAFTYPVSLFDFFTGGHRSGIVAILLAPLILLGAFQSWRRTAHITAYLALTLALYFVWPEGQGYRFMIPVIPFLLILMVSGLDVIAQLKTPGNCGNLLAGSIEYGLPALFLVVSSLLVGTGRISQDKWNPYDQPSSEMFRWIKSNTAGDAVISFFKPRAMHLLADRICLTGMPEDVRKASYFVYTKERDWNEGEPAIQAYQQAAPLTLAFENRNFAVYRVGGALDAALPRDGCTGIIRMPAQICEMF